MLINKLIHYCTSRSVLYFLLRKTVAFLGLDIYGHYVFVGKVTAFYSSAVPSPYGKIAGPTLSVRHCKCTRYGYVLLFSYGKFFGKGWKGEENVDFSSRKHAKMLF